jgi:hypothetical protein
LEARRVDVATLRSQDEVDAALAALTGLLALEGEFVAVGDPDEGVIVLPCRTLLPIYERDPSVPKFTPREQIVAEVSLLRLEAWADTLRVVLQHAQAGTSLPSYVLDELRAVQADVEARSVASEG